MEVNFSFVESMKVLSSLNAASNPMVHLRIGKYEINLNFAHACAISNKIFLDFNKTNKIKKEYEFKCDIYDDRTHGILRDYIKGVGKFSNVSESVLRDFYRIGCSIDNNDMRMQYILKCIPQEITLDNVEDFSEHVVFLSSEDSVYNKFVDFVSSHISDISFDVLFKLVSVHGYDFFEKIITKSQSSAKKDNFIISIIEKNIKYSRFVGSIELSNDPQNYISQISSVIENNNENEPDREFLTSYLTTNYIKLSMNKFSEQQNQIHSLNKANLEQQNQLFKQQKQIDSLIKRNSEQQNQIDSLNKRNSEQQKQIDSLIKTNSEQQKQIDSLIERNSEQQNQINNDFDKIYAVLKKAASSNDESPFLFAKISNLLNIKTNDGLTPILLAAKNNDINLVKMLFKYGADPKIKDNIGRNILHGFCKNKDCKIDSVKFCLQYVNINDVTNGKWTALHYASNYQNKQVVEFLLQQNGINPNLKTQIGNTPILLAAKNNDIDLVQMLCKYGADAKVKYNDGRNILHWFCKNKNCHIDSVKFSLQYVNINDVTIDKNWTALHYASDLQNKQVVEFLLQQNGINPNIKNKDGFPAYHFGNDEIKEIFKKYNVNVEQRCNDDRKVGIFSFLQRRRLFATELQSQSITHSSNRSSINIMTH